MRRRRSSFPELVLGVLLAGAPRAAWAQACCAGSGALTPGRLAIHERALVGAQLRAADVYGSFDGRGHYSTPPPGAGEVDFEEDVFGSVRFLRRGQASLFVPVVETHRRARSLGAELGGGLGDVNLSARWDFVDAGEYRVMPGVGLLAGLTFPTGTAPDAASKPQATDATGIGAFQGNVGLALEQTFGPWLVNATLLAAKRTPREANGVRTTLGTQFTALAAVAYAFPDDSAAAILASYTFEGDATIDGHDAPDSGRRLMRVSLAGAHPLSDRLRLQGSLSLDPPLVYVGQNQTTAVGFTLALLFSWS